MKSKRLGPSSKEMQKRLEMNRLERHEQLMKQIAEFNKSLKEKVTRSRES
ncbi:MAG: hypothetical protein JOZ53_04610 [Planctomycetaceae bacterium]|nr:hypothetical protein [Planctomycetaceae bacterium]